MKTYPTLEAKKEENQHDQQPVEQQHLAGHNVDAEPEEAMWMEDGLAGDWKHHVHSY